MNLWPILLRELRAESRKSGNHWLRVFGGLAGMVVFWLLVWQKSGGYKGFGIQLFIFLHATVMVLIWVLVPLLTADCISRERREGTLGLLFLTPLTSRSVILAKCLSQALRAILLWLSIVPIMSLALLMGGVSLEDIGTAFVLELLSIMLAMVAGLAASSRALRWGAAMGLAVLTIGWVIICMGMIFTTLALFHLLPLTPGFSWEEFIREIGIVEFVFVSLILALGGLPDTSETGWVIVFQSIPGWWPEWKLVLVQLALLSILLCFWLLARAAKRVECVVRGLPVSNRVSRRISAVATKEIASDGYQRRARGRLERNPIQWLLQRTLSARITPWIWGLVTVLACFFFLGGMEYRRGVERGLLFYVLTLGMAFTAATLLQRQRESGELELLLVTPQSMSRFVRTWIFSIWRQFSIPLLILAMDWISFATYIPVYSADEDVGWFALLWGQQFAHSGLAIISLVAVFIVPVVGLYFSTSQLHYLWAWAATAAFTHGIPTLAYHVTARSFDVPMHGIASGIAIICQLIAFIVCGRLLKNRLASRSFALPG